MVDQETKTPTDADAGAGDPSGHPTDLSDHLEERLRDALQEGAADTVRALVEPLNAADVADLLEHLATDDRRAFLDVLGEDLDADVLPELDEEVLADVVDHLEVEQIAAAVVEMDSDDAITVLEDLDEADKREILEAIPDADRIAIEQGLAYPENTAGRLMQREVVTVPTYYTVGETIDFLRQNAERDVSYLPDQFYDIYVVDPQFRPLGAVSLSRLLRSKRPVRVTDIMDTNLKRILVSTDREEVAFIFRQRDLVSASVIDQGGRLVGVIHIDDVVDVIEEEHEEDIMRMGGLAEADLYSGFLKTTKARFSWLLINLGTAIAASLVIGLFEGTIQQMVALAVLMPIVASMGGNAGTQTLTVAVRALATKELTSTNAMRVIGKEILVGTANGALFAVIAGVVAWLWFQSAGIGVVIALAMVVNLVVAGLAGSAIPVVLDKLKIDPAVASGVFLTTVTDVVGFFAFLGLAAWMLI
ncbi:MAG: magnesium transporter [Hyphomicrobiales bacterium]|nr:magnesium transporter [Hyphomicrobiales bacterium]MCP5373913.1 magnesium transporter [Hyphomicrobiales bacterium]